MAADSVNLPQGYKLDSPGLPEGYTLDPETSVGGALGRGAIDAIPFGTKGAAALEASVGDGTYDKYLAELDQMLSADKDQHPIAHGIGETVGTVAPFAIPGVGEALGAETVAGRAAVGAGLGAVQGASNTRAEMGSADFTKDVGKGAALGALFNPIVGAAGDMIGNAAGKAAPALEDFANAKAVQTGGLRPSMLGRLEKEEVQDLGKFMTDNGLTQGDMAARLQKAQMLKQVYGNKIGSMGDTAAVLDDPTPYAEALKESSLKYSGSGAPEAQQLGKTYLGGAHDIMNQLPAGSKYTDIQDLKEMYGDLAFAADHSVKNPAAADVYGTLKQMQKDLVSKSPQEYQQLMKGYSNSADIADGFQKQLGISRAGGAPAKGFGMAGKMGGMVTGGNVPATAGLAGILAPTHPFMALGVGSTLLTNPQVMSNVAGKGASMMGSLADNGLSKAAPAITEGTMGHMAEHGAVHGLHNAVESGPTTSPIPQQYNSVFQNATKGLKDKSEIHKAVTVTDFLLQSRDPNYAVEKKKLNDSQQ